MYFLVSLSEYKISESDTDFIFNLLNLLSTLCNYCNVLPVIMVRNMTYMIIGNSKCLRKAWKFLCVICKFYKNMGTFKIFKFYDGFTWNTMYCRWSLLLYLTYYTTCPLTHCRCSWILFKNWIQHLLIIWWLWEKLVLKMSFPGSNLELRHSSLPNV